MAAPLFFLQTLGARKHFTFYNIIYFYGTLPPNNSAGGGVFMSKRTTVPFESSRIDGMWSVPLTSLTGKQVEDIIEEFTVVGPRFGKDEPDVLRAAFVVGGKLYAPRFACNLLYGCSELNLSKPFVPHDAAREDKYTFNGELQAHKFQDKAAESILPWLSREDENGRLLRNTEGIGGLLVMPPGKGKTVIGCYVMSVVKGRTLVTVPTKALVAQWIERVNQFLPHLSVEELRGGKCVLKGCDVVVATVQSLAMCNYSREMLTGFSTFISDELTERVLPV
jgi:hypothetical protein